MDKAKSEPALPGEGLASSSQSSRANLTHSDEADRPEALNPSHQDAKAETIELGGFRLLDELNAPLVAARPKPRGLLPVPPGVEATLIRDDNGVWKPKTFRVDSGIEMTSMAATRAKALDLPMPRKPIFLEKT